MRKSDGDIQQEVKKFRKNMFFCEKCNAYVTLLTCKARKEGDFRKFLNQEGNVTDFSVDSINYCKNICNIDVEDVDYNFHDFTCEDLSRLNKKKNLYNKSQYNHKEENRKRVFSLRKIRNAD